MHRSMSVMVAVVVLAGCGSSSTDPSSDAAPPTQTAATIPTATTFAGDWKATDPHPDFFRLSVVSKSSELGTLAARLTFSGVYWEGSGRIEGDAFIANMETPGVPGSARVLTARAGDGGALRVTMRALDGSTIELKFVRAN